MNLYAVKLIKKFEGWTHRPYRCPAGKWTIGCGHKIRRGERFFKLTDEDIIALLERDLWERQRQLARLVHVPLTAYEEGALLSFIFNMGAGVFQRSTLRMRVNRKEHAEVFNEFRKWIWAGGKKMPGLLVRRTEEARCYLGIF